MDARQIERVETSVESIACLLFGGALGSAVYAFSTAAVSVRWPIGFAVLAGLLAAFVSRRLLGRLSGRRSQFKLPSFDAPDLRNFDHGELILTDADRLDVEPRELVLCADDRLNDQALAEGPLVLDDVLAEIGPDARVVRLFDRARMPTPGQLQSRIDSHLGNPRQRQPIPDASQALSDALAELRRSLR